MGTTTRGAEVKFVPAIGVSVHHDGNVAVIGDSTGQGDDAATIAADLILTRSTPTSTLSFTYRPVYIAYRENSELNYFGQSARLGYSHNSSERKGVNVDFAGSRTERQGVRPFRPEQPVSFVVRTMETRGDVRVGGTMTAGRRNEMDWSVNAGLAAFDSEDLDDSVSYGAAGGWRYDLSDRSSLGIGLRLDFFTYSASRTTESPDDPPLPSDTSTQTLGLVGTYKVGRLTALQYGAGATRSEIEGVSDVNFAADFSVSRTLTEVSELTAGLRQSVGPGTGLGGATLDSGTYVSYRHRAQRRGVEAVVLAGLWRRDGNAVAGGATGSTIAWSSAESIGWAFNRFVALSLVHAYTDQSVDQSQPSDLNTSHNTYGLLFRWAIRGR